jgi:hypothetical protein
VHEHHVDGDAVQPGAELGLAAEVFQALVGLDEDLLDDVFKVGPGAEHAVDEAGDIGAAALVQLPERRRLAGCGARDEPLLVGDGGLHFAGPASAREPGEGRDESHLRDGSTH